MLLLIFLFINLIKGDSCDKRTSYYNAAFMPNNNYYYFDPDTYLESSNSMSVEDYKNTIKTNIQCTGEWCIDNKWGCKVGDSKNCYNVEHMIPKANNISQIKGCSLDIRGNYIMAYGAWNQALSNGYYGEKTFIYGNERMKSAYRSVYLSCHKKEPLEYPKELCIVDDTGMPSKYVPLVFIGIFMSLFMIGMIMLFHHKFCEKQEKDDNSQIIGTYSV